jgi:hypothetical protein
MRTTPFFSCLVAIIVYFSLTGCSDPQSPPEAYHYTRVPQAKNLQAVYQKTPSGKRTLRVSWEFDTLNLNLRSWDFDRATIDTAKDFWKTLLYVNRSTFLHGYPFVVDSSSELQDSSPDSIRIFYRLRPNGGDNFVGPLSDILLVTLYKDQ